MKLLLVLLLMFPLTATAFCEREETLYTNSINLLVKVKELHETSTRLFEQKQLLAGKLHKTVLFYADLSESEYVDYSLRFFKHGEEWK